MVEESNRSIDPNVKGPGGFIVLFVFGVLFPAVVLLYQWLTGSN